MADVEALVALCRRFAEKADVWTYALGYFDKQTDLKRMEMIAPACQIQDRFFRNAVMISASFGAEAGYLAPVLHIGRAIPYSIRISGFVWTGRNAGILIRIPGSSTGFPYVKNRRISGCCFRQQTGSPVG